MEEKSPQDLDKAAEIPQERKGPDVGEPEIATEEELDDLTGGLNLVNRASCTTTQGAMNTVVSIGG